MSPIINTVLIAIAAFSIGICHADEKYAVDNIPKELLHKADAVMRDYHLEVQISASDKISVKEWYVVTILNQKGEDYAKGIEYYDKYTKIEHIKGYLYDKDGKEVRKLKNTDIRDYAVFDGVTIYNDDRRKEYEFGYSVYPYTVEYEVTQSTSSSLNMPSFDPQPGYNCAVEKARVDILYAPNIPIRYKTFHIDIVPQLTSGTDTKQISLSLASLPAQSPADEFTPVEPYWFPSMIFAIDDFNIANYTGTMDTWSSFGKFFYNLNAGRDDLPVETKRLVHELTDTCKTDFEKIDRLYTLVKKTTRYVAINLGIGGWQCFDAPSVVTNGYGDCKALSNYMKALLKVAGINSYATLAYADMNKVRVMDKNFPYNQFNHVVLCVPQPKDTLWLDCTSKDNPTGYLSCFTGNRQVLVVQPEGGQMVKAPTYSCNENILDRIAIITIDSNDALAGKASLNYNGYFWDKENHIKEESKNAIENHLNRQFELPRYNVTDYTFTDHQSHYIPGITEQVSLKGSANITRSGKRVFLSTDIIPFTIKSPSTYEERKTDFQITHGYQVNDTIAIHLDGVYITEALPDEVNVNYPFAEYYYKVVFNDSNNIQVIRHYRQKEGIYPAKMFPDYIALSRQINVGNTQNKVVLVKK